MILAPLAPTSLTEVDLKSATDWQGSLLCVLFLDTNFRRSVWQGKRHKPGCMSGIAVLVFVGSGHFENMFITITLIKKSLSSSLLDFKCNAVKPSLCPSLVSVEESARDPVPRACGASVPRPGTGPAHPAVEVQRRARWTTREVAPYLTLSF